MLEYIQRNTSRKQIIVFISIHSASVEHEQLEIDSHVIWFNILQIGFRNGSFSGGGGGGGSGADPSLSLSLSMAGGQVTTRITHST